MKYHLHKKDISWEARKDEGALINKLFYRRDGEKKAISGFKRSFDGLNEHEIIELLSRNIYTKHHKYELFYHWYERRYKVNIIQDYSNSILLTPIWDNSIIQSVKCRNKKIENEVRDLVLHRLDSSRFKGFSVVYEAMYDFYPKIEQFSLNQVIGEEFLKYMINLFPFIKEVVHDNGRYKRFELPEYDSPDILYYNRGLPCFYTKIPDKFNVDEVYNRPMALLKQSEKELEDIIRTSKGLPKIGEGWISETNLFYEVKEALSPIDVIHHGQPKWLGLQHFDIWIPSLNVAIEYQGVQHDKPVEFFGGEKAFESNKERDARKKRLCEANQVKLIEVRKGYDLKSLISEIKSYQTR